MTLYITTRSTSQQGDGSNREFYYDFPVLDVSELYVYTKEDDASVEVLRSDYNADVGPEGGMIYFTGPEAPSATTTVNIQRWVENTKTTDYVENDPFPANAHENTLDRIVMMIQQCLQFYGVPQPGAYLMWDEEGERVINGPDAADLAYAEEHAHEATASWLLALEAAMAAANWAGGALNTNFTYNSKTSKSAYHYATLAMVYTIFPVNTVCWFGQNAAPIGWTTQTQFTDCLIGVKSETPGAAWYVATNPWTFRSPAGGSRAWQTVSINALGDVMLAAAYGGGTPQGRMYRSLDYGVNWAEIGPTVGVNKYWMSTDMDATGTNMIACSYSGRVYTSANVGANWTERYPDGVNDKLWDTVCCDSTGTHMYVGAYGTKLFHSANSGVSWVEIKPKGNFAGNWITVRCSADGVRVIAVENSGSLGTYGRVWQSTNCGATWAQLQPAEPGSGGSIPVPVPAPAGGAAQAGVGSVRRAGRGAAASGKPKTGQRGTGGAVCALARAGRGPGTRIDRRSAAPGFQHSLAGHRQVSAGIESPGVAAGR